jgi:DNA helicase IV
MPPARPEPAVTERPDPRAAAPTDPAAAILASEREHLRRSREFLELMRTDVLSLQAMAGDRVSQEYLKADRYRRAEALKDLPDTPLFFGRLDYRPGALAGLADGNVAAEGRSPTDADGSADRNAAVDGNGRADVGARAGGGAARGGGAGRSGEVAGESFHVGRRHVHDPQGSPVVIDWRAPVSRPFYRASQAEPMGLDLRRRFGFSGGELTAFEDENLGRPQAGPAASSRILIDEIERPRSGPMRDIVATIQPEQDDIVRAGVEQTVCVQGAPGTGKTAVGLHRVAYLLYAHAQRLSRGGVLVVGPNAAFLAYIQNVLPALGELDVAQRSVADLLAAVPVRGTDSDVAARIKGDVRMAEVLRRALWEQLTEPAEPIMLVRGSRRWRVAVHEITELTAELRQRGVRYATGRQLLGHRIAHVILSKMEAAGETCDDRTHEAVRRTRPVQAAVDQAWPKADPARLVFRLLSDPELLARAAEGLLDPAEQYAVRWQAPPRAPGSARWSAADAVLVDEAADLLERTPSLAHIVVDEAQDLSPMQCRAIGRRCATGSATVLGDIAQGTTAWATSSWEQMLGYLGKGDAELRVLDTGYRVPREILDFASRLLAQIAPGLSPARSVRHDPGALHIRALAPGALDEALAAACAEALTRPGSAAVIAADDQLPAAATVLAAAGLPHALLAGAASGEQITLVPVTLAKGLEFDQVIVLEPGRIAAAESRGLHRLYVALTRAVSRLTVLHAEPLPAALR